MNAWHGPPRHLTGSELTARADATIWSAATSCCAVTAIFADGGTRGVHPRFSCVARRPESTANSNAFIPSGRLTNGSSLRSARARLVGDRRSERRALVRVRPDCRKLRKAGGVKYSEFSAAGPAVSPAAPERR